ncbi:hypothetical protein EDB92DRAFT_1825062 [Lactarius akahatsu]|uniref:Secreted protein n=1 Tax=Lactarius akahatsu TaxID=416441 RepID=A0AAD4QFJ2_9AGAM|nr:hypothetical protein EDB92DRAFT_1825062 [Lactarius akahatsu]
MLPSQTCALALASALACARMPTLISFLFFYSGDLAGDDCESATLMWPMRLAMGVGGSVTCRLKHGICTGCIVVPDTFGAARVVASHSDK